MIRRTHYVIAVPDLERSAAFYRDVLGFDVRDSGDPGWRGTAPAPRGQTLKNV